MTTGLLALFVGALLASTILPSSSEVLLYVMLESGGYSSLLLLVTATCGNTLGGVITYAIGLLLSRGLGSVAWGQKLQCHFKLERTALMRVRRWGIPCLLWSWLPLLGDPLCLAAGYLRLAFWYSVLMIAIGKFARYLVLLWVFGWQ